MYDDVLQRIESQNQGDRVLAERARRWIAFAYRPLTAQALQEFVATEPDARDFDTEAQSPIGLILDVYECNGKKLTRSRPLTSTSVACGIPTVSDPKELIERESSTSHLLLYTAYFWTQHATASPGADLTSPVHRFLATNPRVILARPTGYDRWGNKNWRQLILRLQSCHGCEVAAFFGLVPNLELFLQNAGNALKLTNDFKPLALAAVNDQVASVKLLLDYGADIECMAISNDDSPLRQAIRSQALNAATALVESGANVMAVNGDDPSLYLPIASVWAKQPGHYLELLVSAGAKIQKDDIFNVTPLMKGLMETDDVELGERLFQ
ncbi:MAG: hypothetical protein Q9173_001335 [Seirophora scorigena]